MSDKRVFSTPMMVQYQGIKEQYQDCLLFFRLGDFYELFLSDAKVGAQVLGITLTRRPRGKDGDIPMAGVPYHAADAYMAKLVRAGYKVAICEQTSQPDKRGIVEREVVRVVTPGTVLDDKALEHKHNNYIISLSLGKKRIGLAFADLSTGEFRATQRTANDSFWEFLDRELIRLRPVECVLSSSSYENNRLLQLLAGQQGLNTFPFTSWGKHTRRARRSLSEHFGVSTLEGFNLEHQEKACTAAAALLGYLKETQKKSLAHINSVCSYDPDTQLVLDRSTISNLELFTTLRDGERQGSLVGVLDKTCTAGGGRLLRSWLCAPLIKIKKIKERHHAVGKLVSDRDFLDDLRRALKLVGDIERLLSRLSVGVSTPRDLAGLRLSLKQAKEACDLVKVWQGSSSTYLQKLATSLPKGLGKLVHLLDSQLSDDPPTDVKKGDVVKKGVSKKLDTLRRDLYRHKTWLHSFEKKEQEKSGITSLKVRFNKVFGYYIEVSKSNLSKVPNNYQRKQTMVNAERYITPELKDFEQAVTMVETKSVALEIKLFENLISQVLEYVPEIKITAGVVSQLDCLASLAKVAFVRGYVQPEIISESSENVIDICEGRHPVVEALLQDRQFVPNDTLLDSNGSQLLVITGPNMAGKSVYMRQVALITLMAQVGSFVPAKRARLKLVDRIFVRSGAADVITAGLSTFMLEMTETAHILNHATKNSLVIMDEIGRGTSTYDGISIAWAVAEYLLKKIGCKILFATHYHELQELAKEFPEGVKNYQMAVVPSEGRPVFLHQVVSGGAPNSFGVAVAQMAGVPKAVLDRAGKMLISLEKGKV